MLDMENGKPPIGHTKAVKRTKSFNEEGKTSNFQIMMEVMKLKKMKSMDDAIAHSPENSPIALLPMPFLNFPSCSLSVINPKKKAKNLKTQKHFTRYQVHPRNKSFAKMS